MTTLSLFHASAILDAVLEHARTIDCAPLTVALLGSGGHPAVLTREDGRGILRPRIAEAKAWGAFGTGLGTRTLSRRARDNPAFLAALASVSEGHMVPVPGRVLIRNADEEIVSAVGESDDRSEIDEACAIAGIEKSAFRADPGEDRA